MVKCCNWKFILIITVLLVFIILIVVCLKPLVIYLNTPDYSTAEITSKNAYLYVNGELIACQNVKVYHYIREKIPRVRFLEAIGIKVSEMNDDHNADQIYAQIPLIPVLKVLGAEVNWVDEYNANIVLDGREYRLNIEGEINFWKSGDKPYNNMLFVLGASMYDNNSEHILEAVERDVLLDLDFLNSVLKGMGMEVFFNVDYDESIIEIRITE